MKKYFLVSVLCIVVTAGIFLSVKQVSSAKSIVKPIPDGWSTWNTGAGFEFSYPAASSSFAIGNGPEGLSMVLSTNAKSSVRQINSVRGFDFDISIGVVNNVVGKNDTKVRDFIATHPKYVPDFGAKFTVTSSSSSNVIVLDGVNGYRKKDVIRLGDVKGKGKYDIVVTRDFFFCKNNTAFCSIQTVGADENPTAQWATDASHIDLVNKHKVAQEILGTMRKQGINTVSYHSPEAKKAILNEEEKKLLNGILTDLHSRQVVVGTSSVQEEPTYQGSVVLDKNVPNLLYIVNKDGLSLNGYNKAGQYVGFVPSAVGIKGISFIPYVTTDQYGTNQVISLGKGYDDFDINISGPFTLNMYELVLRANNQDLKSIMVPVNNYAKISMPVKKGNDLGPINYDFDLDGKVDFSLSLFKEIPKDQFVGFVRALILTSGYPSAAKLSCDKILRQLNASSDNVEKCLGLRGKMKTGHSGWIDIESIPQYVLSVIKETANK